MKTFKASLLIIFFLLAAGCSKTTMPTYTTMLIGKHHSYGSMQEKHGDLLKAEKLYFMELVHSRMGHASAKRIPTALYNLGRVKGYLCKNEEAERYLVTAYDLVNNGPGHSENEKIKYNLELAKFYFENNLFEDAEPYYASLFNRLSTTPNSQDIKALLRKRKINDSIAYSILS